MLFYTPVIRITGIQHVGHGKIGCGPGYVIPVIAPESRGHIRNAAIGGLCVTDIIEPLGIERGIAKNKTFPVGPVARSPSQVVFRYVADNRPAFPYSCPVSPNRHF